MPGYFTESKTLFLKRTWSQKTSPLFLWYILVNFMDQDPCTKLYGVLISFHEVRNFHSFEFGVSDVIPPNVRKTFASGFSCISFLILWRTSNNKHDWTSVKYLHLLYPSRIHKQLQHVFLTFWEFWECLTIIIKMIGSFVESFHAYLRAKINFNTHFFLKILERNSKLVILGDLGMPGHTNLKW